MNGRGADEIRERFVDVVSRRLSRAIVTACVPLRIGSPVMSISFDDIPDSAALVGARILEERGVRGTFYVCGEIAGRDWLNYRLASLDQVAALAQAGHEIGCHTASHPAATRIGPSDYVRDVERNAAILEPIVGKLDTFAYPFGAIALRHKLRLQERFAVCRSVHGRMAVGSYDRGRLHSSPLEDASIDEAGIDELLDEAVAKTAWLTFYAHDVSDTPSRFGVSPTRLAYAVDAALARGIRIETIANVVALNRRARVT